jgi:hypothetical protein
LRSAGSCLKIASLVSESVRDSGAKGAGNIWIPAKDLKNLFYDTDLFKIYLGLLFQQALLQPVNFIDSDGQITNFSTLLESKKDDLFLFQNKLKEFVDLTGNVNTAFKNFNTKEKNGENPSNDDIYNYISTSIDVIEYGFSIVEIFHQNISADEYLGVARKSNDLYKSIYTKNYTQAVSNALDIFAEINKLVDAGTPFAMAKEKPAVKSYTGPEKDQKEAILKNDEALSKSTDSELKAVASIAADNSVDPDVRTVMTHGILKKLLDFIEKVKPYALFMANMVEAKGEDEVKAALESVILPVGSSSVKKFAKCNISVQAYLGAFWAPWNNAKSTSGAWADKFGVTAPIGISWTPGCLSLRNGGAISLFTSLFDIGAIVDYKLKKEPDATNGSDVVSKDYKIQLGNIFSPGAYIVYGWPWNLPLSFGVGGQYGPGLSKIDAGNNTIVTNPFWRWNIFLAVDLPLFNIANKPKDKN